MLKEDILKQCKVEDNIVKLPNIVLDRKLYLEVAKSLELIGGKWKGGKVQGFVFPKNPSDLLEQIANGESRNLKKEFQFFATPPDLADELVSLSDLNWDWSILEPSAGQGSIVDAVKRKNKELTVYMYELMDVNRAILADKYGNDFIKGSDFLTSEILHKYDRIIANPPFSNNQDIDHIYRMYEFLEDGGRLVSIASKHWQLSSNKKETTFKNWLDSVDAEVIEIERGRFKDSGTTVGGVIIIINKK